MVSYNEQYSLFKKDYDDYVAQDRVYAQLLNLKYFDIVNSDKLINKTLRNQLNALGARFTLDSDSCAVTYSDILNNIINEAFKLISYYGNSSGDLSEAAENDFNEKEKQYEENAAIAQKEYNRLIVFLNENEEVITYIRPVVMTYNRYSLSAISGWDGNRLYTGTGNTGDYLYTPQVGAGVKETDGSFTGIVIGHKKESDKSKVGLFGFNTGIESIFLNAEDGSAIFGVSGEGQIQMNPGGTSTIAGWQINVDSLSKADTNIGKVSLISNINKTVDIDGINRYIAFEASKDSNKAIITYDGWFKSNYGNIGGWTIASNKLSSKKIEINSDGSIKHTDGDWSINNDGSAIFENLTANKKGNIGGWTISSNKLSSNNIELNSSGSIKHLNSDGVSNWSITSSGYAYFKNVAISDNSTYSSTYGSPFGGTCIGHIETISAGYIKTNYLDAMNANINSLIAEDAKIRQLVAEQISATKVYADSVSTNALTTAKAYADTVTANTLSAAKVYADQVSAKSVSANRITAGTVNGRSVSWQSINVVSGGGLGYALKNLQGDKMQVITNVYTKSIYVLGAQ